MARIISTQLTKYGIESIPGILNENRIINMHVHKGKEMYMVRVLGMFEENLRFASGVRYS